MSIQSLLIQVAFLYAPLVHSPTQEVTPNIFRGHDPKIKEIRALHDKGFKTIISLRTNPENKKRIYCDKLGMKWIQIRTGVFLTPTDEQFDQFRTIVKNPANLPCYVSCELDMDRTSVYLAAYQMVDQGWSAEQIAEEFKLNHQKRWWPEFRKYQGAVIAYAQRKKDEARASKEVVSSNR